MRAIAKRLVLRESAAAQADGGSAGQSELLASLIENGKFGRIIGLEPERPIVGNSYLDSHAADVSRWKAAVTGSR